MQAQATQFVRRTTLLEGEYQKNFRMIDCDAIRLLKSVEARKITPMIGTLYLALIDAPVKYWERKGVLHFRGEEKAEGKLQTAWQQLVSLLGCGNSTAKKALDWMREQGIIGYYAGKNGAGIRIFINRAISSIGKREEQKNLHLVPAPIKAQLIPSLGAPFNADSLEIQDTNNISAARENEAEQKFITQNKIQQPIVQPNPNTGPKATNGGELKGENPSEIINLRNVVEQLRRDLEPCVRSAASQAAAREQERTREWFVQKALPKAVRIAQKESYDVLRKYGLITKVNSQSNVGRQIAPPATSTVASAVSSASVAGASSSRKKTSEEIRDLAESCIALFVSQGKGVDATLGELSANAGGWLSIEDLESIREMAHHLLHDARG